jgi:single-strand DNA-binding protein
VNNTLVTVVGNVATEPERRDTPTGPVTSFRLASTDRRYDRPSGMWQNAHTSFYRVSCWHGLAGRAATHLSKGDPVVVVGRLQVKEWQRDGRTGLSVEIDADNLGPDLRRIGATVLRTPRPVPAVVDASEPAA